MDGGERLHETGSHSHDDDASTGSTKTRPKTHPNFSPDELLQFLSMQKEEKDLMNEAIIRFGALFIFLEVPKPAGFKPNKELLKGLLEKVNKGVKSYIVRTTKKSNRHFINIGTLNFTPTLSFNANMNNNFGGGGGEKEEKATDVLGTFLDIGKKLVMG